MKQFEPIKKQIGDYTFYIRPLPAFKAAKISGDLAAVASPLIAGIAPIMGLASNDSSIFDMDLSGVAPTIAEAFSSLSGDKLEKLMKSLLTEYGTIAVDLYESKGPQKLTEDLCNEIFCGNAQDMFVLAFHVIGANFGDFFDRLKSQFGTATQNLLTLKDSENTENSMPRYGSQTSN